MLVGREKIISTRGGYLGLGFLKFGKILGGFIGEC